MSFLHDLPAINQYVYWGGMIAVIVATIALAVIARRYKGKKAYRLAMFVGAAALVGLLVTIGTSSRVVGDDQIGIGAKRTYDKGVYMFPSEEFVAVNRTGNLLIQYPSDQVMILVTYRIEDPSKLLGDTPSKLVESLKAHKAGASSDPIPGRCGFDDNNRQSRDALAAYLRWELNKRCPLDPTSVTNFQVALEPFTKFAQEKGISGSTELVQKQVIKRW
jgi:hypothetical protein